MVVLFWILVALWVVAVGVWMVAMINKRMREKSAYTYPFIAIMILNIAIQVVALVIKYKH